MDGARSRLGDRDRGHPARTGAYTLIEVVVAAAIGLLVLALVWTLITTMTKGFSSSRDLLNSLQGAHLLIENLRNDLSGCVYELNTKPIEFSADFFQLDFHSFDPEANRSIDLSNPKAVLEKITYKFDPVSNQVSRNGKPFTFAKFERVTFFFQAPDFAATPEKRYGNFVSVRVTCASEVTIAANKGRSDANRLTKGVVTLITSVGMAHKAGQDLFPVWSPAPEPTLEVR